MVRKIFGIKNITHLLYGIAILLPMMSILGRVCYTVVNKNANQSYNGQIEESAIITMQDTINDISGSSINSYTVNSITYYYFDDIKLQQNVYTNNYQIIGTSNVQQNWFNVTNFKFDNVEYSNIKSLMLYYINATTYRLSGWTFEYSEDMYFETGYRINLNGTRYTADLQKDQIIGKQLSFNINSSKIYLNSNTSDSTKLNKLFPFMYVVNYYNSSLDNAFEYSLQSFTEDNNLGNVDMFSWFTDLFLDQSKPKNALYLNFVNWYLNYTLLVSSGYLLFMVMIWFTQYIRRIMDKSMYQDFGGF